MYLINLIVINLYRKYGVPLHIFLRNWTRGTSHLKYNTTTFVALTPRPQKLTNNGISFKTVNPMT